MATWKKVVVSGSNISQLSNDSLYIHTGSAGVSLTGSFTGSFVGDGSGLSGVTTDITALNAHTASVNSFTGSIDAEVTALMDSTGSRDSHISNIHAFTASADGEITSLMAFTGSHSSSVASRITDLEVFSSSLDASFVTEAELAAATSSLSSSIATDIATLVSFSSSLESTLYNYTGSFAGDGSGLENITVTQNATVTASFTNVTTASITHNFNSDNVIVTVYDSNNQQFIPSTIWTKTANVVEIHFEGTETGRAIVARGGHIVSGSIPFENIIAKPDNLFSGSAQLATIPDVATTISGSFTSVSSSIAADIASNDADIAGLNTYTSSLKSAITVAGANVTVAGNLTVSGTTTTVDSTTVNIGDNIIALNGTGATKGGLAVNDGPASGSLLWDGTNDYWVAGPTGSEVKILLASGDGVLSGSAQIADNISGSITLTSASIASDIAELVTDSGSFSTRVSDLEAFSSSLDAGFVTEAELVAATASLSSSIATDIAGLVTDSGSFSTRVSDLEAFSSSLDAGFVTEAELLSATASLSSSLAADIATNKNNITALDGEVTNLMASTGSVYSHVSGLLSSTGSNYAHISNLNDWTGSAARRVAISGSITEFSASVASDLNNLSQTLKITGSDATTSTVDLKTQGLTFAGTANEIETTVSGQTVTIGLPNNVTIGQDLTVSGNLTVSGTTTTVDSTIVNIGDNIIALNGTGATKGGLAVNDGPDSGSLLWDGTNNYWIAGPSGSEVKVLLASGDGVLSGSAQIETNISGAFTVASASIATDIDAVQLSNSVQDAHIIAIHAFTSSADGEITALMGATSSYALKADITGSFTQLSASIAADIAGVSAGALESGSFAVTLKQDTGSIAFTEGLEIGDVYDQGNGTTDIRVPAGASWLELNYADTDFIYLDGTDAGIVLDNNYEWKFYGATGTFIAPGEIRSNTTVSASVFNVDGGTIVSSSAQTIANLAGTNIISGSAQLNTVPNVAATISGSFTLVSASIAADIAGLGGDYATDAELNAATASLSASLAVDIAALEAFSSSVDTAMNFSGTNVTVVGNLAVNGTGSFAYIEQITGSAKLIGDAFIVLNNNTPAERYAGVSVYDSGSAGTTGSFQFDGQSNDWFYEYTDAGQTDYGVALFGPEYNTKGSPTYLTNNTILKGTGGHHVAESNITDDGTTIGLGSNTSVTGNITVTGTVDGIDLQAASSSVSTRITDLETFSSSLDNTFATDAYVLSVSASLSSSLAAGIATNTNNISGLDTEVTNLMAATGSVYSHVSGLLSATGSNYAHIANLNSFTGSFSSSVASEIAALEAFSSSLDTTFATDAYVLTVSASLSSSLATDIATNKNNLTALDGEVTSLMASTGSIYAHVGNLNAATSSYATKTGLGLVSASVLSSTQQGEVKLTTNGVDGSTIDLGLQTTDTPTFAGLTVTGDLVVTGNTIEAQVTNLNIEDKYILLNSGSTSGDSGIVFGGADGSANQGVGLFWDTSYNSNDGRLGIVNSIAAGATGDQTPSYHIAGVYEGSEANAATAQADHPGNIRIENGEVFIYI